MDYCTVEPVTATSRTRCPECGRAGQLVERITVKAMLRPEALMRLSAPEHRFCSTPACPVVYFGHEEVFNRGEIAVAVFQKEPIGTRTVCYCFAVTEEDIRRELVETGSSLVSRRITGLVRAGRCAYEVKNPQGSCCLGNVAAVTKTLSAAIGSEYAVASRGRATEGNGPGAVCGNSVDGPRVCHS